MKVTYTAPNRSHHYPYAEALNRAGHLHAFVSGFSRLSPRSPLPSVGDKLKRHDFFQNFYLASHKYKAPFAVRSFVNFLSNYRLDQASYKWAKESDAFIYYRTEGLNTTKRLHKEGSQTLCVMEEVNSHVDYAHDLMQQEFDLLGLKKGFEKYEDYNRRLETYEVADCILCPSEFVVRSFLEKGFAPERLMKVNFGFPNVDVQSIDTLEKESDTFRVLYVGQLNYRKGLRYAIEAFKKLNHPKKELIIVGPTTFVTGLEKTTIPDGVTFTGTLKDEALKNQYRRASVFVLPSLEEGLALVQGEALSFGLPVIATTNTGSEDILKDGVDGFIIPPGNASVLADRLQQLADDKALVRNMSVAALQTAKNLGSWDNAVKSLIEQMQALKNRKKL